MSEYRIREFSSYYDGKPMFRLERKNWLGFWCYAGDLGSQEQMEAALRRAVTPKIIYPRDLPPARSEGGEA